jgi:hypothetical protein
MKKLDTLLQPLPPGRRVIVLEEGLRRARQDVKGEKEMWKAIAKEDLGVDQL